MKFAFWWERQRGTITGWISVCFNVMIPIEKVLMEGGDATSQQAETGMMGRMSERQGVGK